MSVGDLNKAVELAMSAEARRLTLEIELCKAALIIKRQRISIMLLGALVVFNAALVIARVVWP